MWVDLPGLPEPFAMIPIDGGAFLMGSDKKADPDAFDDEFPRHEVRVPGFLLGRYPVTQELWEAVTGDNPSFFKGKKRPVEQVSWEDTQIFIKKLNEKTGELFRLPSEAEWEYAARGGPHKSPYRYAGSDKLKEVGWFGSNSHRETKPVGLKAPNELGLYDMSGNVWEWCEDDWDVDYQKAPDNGSAWIDSPDRGSNRVNRGGSYFNDAQNCRVAYRNNNTPSNRNRNLGFRLALSLQLKGKPDGCH
ncbi:MAG: formylglycine-generating enzyme family protein [Saprospiraceae bacterium]|nr:formylglycine-generating enzyme family protein [Saprospiraceae bacterium]